jgi:hypothetical protein
MLQIKHHVHFTIVYIIDVFLVVYNQLNFKKSSLLLFSPFNNAQWAFKNNEWMFIFDSKYIDKNNSCTKSYEEWSSGKISHQNTSHNTTYLGNKNV